MVFLGAVFGCIATFVVLRRSLAKQAKKAKEVESEESEESEERSEDTSQVTSMTWMFNNASSFNQPITMDTSQVTDMSKMFRYASSFNQPITMDTGLAWAGGTPFAQQPVIAIVDAGGNIMTLDSVSSVTVQLFHSPTGFPLLGTKFQRKKVKMKLLRMRVAAVMCPCSLQHLTCTIGGGSLLTS